MFLVWVFPMLLGLVATLLRFCYMTGCWVLAAAKAGTQKPKEECFLATESSPSSQDQTDLHIWHQEGMARLWGYRLWRAFALFSSAGHGPLPRIS